MSIYTVTYTLIFSHLCTEAVLSPSAQEEEAVALLNVMLERNALALLVQRLGLLDDSVPDEAAAIFAIFNIFENMIEVKPEVADLLVEDTEVAFRPPLHPLSDVDTWIYLQDSFNEPDRIITGNTPSAQPAFQAFVLFGWNIQG